VLGDVNADVIARVRSWPRPGEECLAQHVELHCGGVGANCALALRQWGVSTRLVACVGKDPLGEFVLSTLAQSAVDVRQVQRTSKALTGLLYINVTADGQRTFFGSRGANCLLRPPSRKSSSLFPGTVAASLKGYSFRDPGPEKAARQILDGVHANVGWVSLDVGMEPSQKISQKVLGVMKKVDLLFVSNQEATALTGNGDAREAFERLRQAGAREVVMKLGKRGCLIAEANTPRHVPGFAVPVVDSTGAGDAFTAAFSQARLRGWPTDEAALAANAAGAVAASVVGAGDSAPTVKAIKQLMQSQRLPELWDTVRRRVLRRL